MTKTDKKLTPEYLDWHAKLTGLPSVLTDRIWSNLYKKYKKETGYEPWQLSEAYASEASLLINSKPENKVSDLSFSEQCEEKGPITFEAKPDSELIIKSNSPCPICDEKLVNFGLHGEWYHKNGNQFPYDPELAKLYFQDKLEMDYSRSY
ncbi:hypothetical protein RhiirA4_472350 [Rhizophagus irregularis]|uniref:Uncharacterized protein n=1 Tax=Rhizophagus irregularis TaxID=588596 RepID=A0A2I1H4V3_9GLOM|nr:hypothetical protein RhiirA4_472350 [Rhizophagus irregularis]